MLGNKRNQHLRDQQHQQHQREDNPGIQGRSGHEQLHEVLTLDRKRFAVASQPGTGEALCLLIAQGCGIDPAVAAALPCGCVDPLHPVGLRLRSRAGGNGLGQLLSAVLNRSLLYAEGNQYQCQGGSKGDAIDCPELVFQRQVLKKTHAYSRARWKQERSTDWRQQNASIRCHPLISVDPGQT